MNQTWFPPIRVHTIIRNKHLQTRLSSNRSNILNCAVCLDRAWNPFISLHGACRQIYFSFGLGKYVFYLLFSTHSLSVVGVVCCKKCGNVTGIYYVEKVLPCGVNEHDTNIQTQTRNRKFTGSWDFIFLRK